MDWLSLVRTAVSVGLEAFRAGKIMAADKEAVDGQGIVARMHAKYEAAKHDKGLPAGVRND